MVKFGKHHVEVDEGPSGALVKQRMMDHQCTICGRQLVKYQKTKVCYKCQWELELEADRRGRI